MTDRSASAPAGDGDRALGQFFFVAIGLAIIIGGLWSLYMGDAPYHPEITGSDSGMVLTTD